MRGYAENLLKDMLGREASFHNGQWEAIESALSSKRTLVIQRTGWGKSIVYFIASKIIKERVGGVTLLVSPLLSLMRNQIESASKIGINACTINSDNQEEWNCIEEKLKGGTCDILLVSPETLSKSDFRQRIIPMINSGINMIVIDEAHCISDWGHDFRPDYFRIVNIIKMLPPNVPVIATTATANERVINDIKEQLGENINVIKGSLMRESLRIQVIKTDSQIEKMAWLLDNINNIDGSGIIYCLTTRDCDRVAELLSNNGINALAYHTRLAKDKNENKKLCLERENLLIENKVKVIVSTSKLGMGFDKGDISFVIHYNSPGNLIRYYQEIGRAGRKLDVAYAVMLVGKEDKEIAKYFIESAFPSRKQMEDILYVIESSTVGINLNSIVSKVNMSERKIKQCIKLLELHEVIAFSDRKYFRNPMKEYSYEIFRSDEILGIRNKELEVMDKYISTDECYMAFIAKQLDDRSFESCGKCCNCSGEVYFDEKPSYKSIKIVESFVNNISLTIKVRKRWPAGTVRDTQMNIPINEQNEIGRVLSNYADIGWGKIVSEDKYYNKYFRDELVDATVDLIENKWQGLEKLDSVAYVPSLRRPELVKSFAYRVAKKLNVKFLDIIKKPKETEQQKLMENSSMQAKNAYNSFDIEDGIEYGNILLIDDMVDSGWTLTVCGALLKRNGADKVYPYALASTEKSGGGE